MSLVGKPERKKSNSQSGSREQKKERNGDAFLLPRDGGDRKKARQTRKELLLSVVTPVEKLNRSAEDPDDEAFDGCKGKNKVVDWGEEKPTSQTTHHMST